MHLIFIGFLATLGVSQPPVKPADKVQVATAAHKSDSLVSTASGEEASQTEDEVAPEDEEQASEMEELRALEGVALDPQAKPTADLLQSFGRLGIASPLRETMRDAFSLPPADDELPPFELPRITNLANFDASQVKDQFDIPIEMQPLVAQYIQFFQGPGRKWFRRWMSRSTRYIPMMQPLLESAGLPKDTVYLAMIESGFSPHAYSWARAAGPWQFISSTAKLFGLKQDFWIDERRDPTKATLAAARYLDRLHSQLGSWYLAWAAYNGGRLRVQRVMERKGTTDFWELSEGRGLAKETKHYVPKLIACALVAKNPAAFGFGEQEFDYLTPVETASVKLTEAADLEVLARAAEIPLDSLQELNPELKRWCTPPASEQHPYLLRLPKSAEEKFAENYRRIAPRERLAFRVHRVRRGDTLSAIAATYHSAPEAILRLNGVRNARLLRVNTDLVIPVPSAWAVKSGKSDPALDRQVARARRGGFTSARPEQEIPAGTVRKAAVATGTVKTEVIDGKTRVTYGVQSGDTLWSISQHFSCSVQDLRTWNRLPKRAKALQVGTVLYIWSAVQTASAAPSDRASKL